MASGAKVVDDRAKLTHWVSFKRFSTTRTTACSEKQIALVAERGLFVIAVANGRHAQAHKPAPEPLSSLRLINSVNKRLDALLANLEQEANAQDKILEAAGLLVKAASAAPDVALATILMNQESGSYPIRHSVDTAIVSLLVARTMKRSDDEVKLIAAAALTMNASMISLQDGLQKSDAPLTEAQRKTIQEHPTASARMLADAGVNDPDWLNIILHHHESDDGTGYPHGKTGAHIPGDAKLISLADRYCARVSTRNYRKSLLPNAALRDMLVADKANIDPNLAKTFIRELGIYPTGTFVKLENGEIGVVTGRGASSTTPIVHSLIGPRGAPLVTAMQRDTSKQLCSIREVLTEGQAAIRVSMHQLWGQAAAL